MRVQAWKSSQYLQEGRAAGVKTGTRPPSRGGGPPLGPAAPSSRRRGRAQPGVPKKGGGEEPPAELSGSPHPQSRLRHRPGQGAAKIALLGLPSPPAEGPLPDGRRGRAPLRCQPRSRGLLTGLSRPGGSGQRGGKGSLSGMEPLPLGGDSLGREKAFTVGKVGRRKNKRSGKGRRRKKEHLPFLGASH